MFEGLAKYVKYETYKIYVGLYRIEYPFLVIRPYQ